MSNITMLRQELKEKQAKLDDYGTWLLNHVSHPDVPKILRLRNELSVVVYTLKTKIDNLSYKRGMLGNEAIPVNNQLIQYINNKINIK
jgi:hypothetical protein